VQRGSEGREHERLLRDEQYERRVQQVCGGQREKRLAAANKSAENS
jgi:hypothetical protein